MRLIVKTLKILILGPFILGLLLVLGLVAIIAVPILWEELVARLTAPPERDTGESTAEGG